MFQRLSRQTPTGRQLCGCAARLLILSAVGAVAPGQESLREPIDLVPADAMLSWQARPLRDRDHADEPPSAVGALVELGLRAATEPLDRATQLNLRMAELAGLVLRYPYAVSLLDVSAVPLETNPDARRVNKLRVAVVAKTGDDVEPFLRVIQKIVNEQTRGGTARLSDRAAERWSYQELRDRRLPDWSTFAWGRLDGFFVMTIGPDVWPAVAATAAGKQRGLSRDTWYAEARVKRAGPALIEIFVAVNAIRGRLDPVVDGQAGAFFEAWDAGGLERMHWAIGFSGRALFCEGHFRSNGQTATRLFADPEVRAAPLLATIPAEAHYAVFAYPPAELLPRFFRSLLVTQAPQTQALMRGRWNRLQADNSVDVQRDLLAHLGDHMILHNDPPHPLQIPVAVTLLFEIKDQPATVRRTLDALCRAWQRGVEAGWDEPAAGAPPQDVAAPGAAASNQARTGQPGQATSRMAKSRAERGGLALVHDDDGIWYLRLGGGPAWLGLAGPAWTVTDRFIIASWSPAALREYLEKIGPAAGKHE